MMKTLRKQAHKLLCTAMAVSTLALTCAGAADGGYKTTAVLSSNLNATVGTVLSSDEIMTAEQALTRAKAEAEARAKAAAEAKAKAEAEAAAKAAAQQAYNALLTAPVYSKTVAYSADLLAPSAVKSNATALGNYKLTFYTADPSENGGYSTTATGTTITEGRTIAVDPSVIPLGSRVYIDGYGVFIAEDTGGAIKSNKIDICVSTSARAYELGIQYADVYLLN